MMNDSIAPLKVFPGKGALGWLRLLEDYAVLGDTDTAALVHCDRIG
jgi:hypothetical protein